MKKFKIATIHANGKTVRNTAGQQFFLPESFRGKAAVGDSIIVINKHYNNSTEIVNGVASLTGPAFDRDEVSFVGTEAEVRAAFYEEQLAAATDQAFLAQHTAKVAKEYEVSVEDLMSA